jgi:ribonuclease R
VGVLRKNQGALFVVADDHRMYRDIYIDPKSAQGITPGIKVLAEITAWDSDEEDPVGVIVQAIGKPGEHETEVRAIALDRGFDGLFPKDVEAEARAIPAISEKDFAGRRDFRNTLTFTIDPKDAKDFDDALSWQKLPNGNYEIGIHIADVSHYVKPGTALDREAARRATSVYLVDRTIPMLPERLSNDLCSLKPHVDRLTFSAVFEITPAGGIIGEWYGKGVIHSAHRFTYEEAQDVIEGRSEELKDAILSLDRLAKIFRTQRIAEGAVEFQSQEVRCELGPRGNVLRIYKKELKDANKLIEEFMLLANRKVTEWVSKHIPPEQQVFVYRIHGEPNEDKMRDLEEFVRTLGIKTRKPGTEITGRDINAMLAQVEHMAEKSYVHIASIRAMAKAIYSTKNIGHFGLGFQHYTHFTSPIRRYPDTMVHRLLDRYLRKEKVSTKELANHERMARYSTEMEISATEAERASIRYKQVEYWADKVGAVWNGKIAGVAPWGIFVEEEATGTEGMIHINDLEDDIYTYEESKHRMVGTREKKIFRLGDPIRARIRAVDQKKRLIGLSPMR